LQAAIERTYLNVPFSEKDSAKGLGARWDPALRKWYVPPGQSLSRFARWLDSPPPAAVKEESEGIALSALLMKIREKVCSATPGPIWVRAEIADLKRKPWGDIYLDLCESDNGQQVAKVSAKLSKHKARQVLEKCSDADVSLKAGVSALILVKPDFHLQYGVSLQVLDVDPAFTLGQLEAKRKQILQKLLADGVADGNRAKRQPQDFSAVAVICPDSSAALGDFKSEAGWLEGLGLCTFYYFTAVFQGSSASASICKAMEAAFAQAAHSHVDAIAFIRGGGATTDMAWLDDYAIARAICKSPVPVLTGLGHEKNTSVADLVANRSFDTPSKVSLHIKESILEQGKRTIVSLHEIRRIAASLQLRMGRNIESLQKESIGSAHRMANTLRHVSGASVREIFLQSNAIVQRGQQASAAHSQLLTSSSRLHRTAGQLLRTRMMRIEERPKSIAKEAKSTLKQLSGQIGFHGREHLQQGRHSLLQYSTALHLGQLRMQRAEEKSRHLMGLVLTREPRNILKHGFAIVRNTENAAITTQRAALGEKELVVLFRDGAIISSQPRAHVTEKGEPNER
jgi:exodeoxyribonuclease VII large subunit